MDINGLFCYDLMLNSKFLAILLKAFEECNIGYLGNNEGWVSVKIV